MRLALIHDEARLRRERSAITRLCVALVDQGAQVVRLVPERFDPFHDDRSEQALSLLPRIDYPQKVPPWQRGARIATLLDDLDRAPPDAIVAFGEGAWAVAQSLAAALDCPLLLEVWSLREAERVAAMRRLAERPIAACIVGSDGLAAWLRSRVDAAIVHHVPVGVGMPPAEAGDLAVEERPRRIGPDSPTRSTFAIIGDGDDLASHVSLLSALRRLAIDLPDLRIALEICGPRGHEVWRAVRRLELLERTSTIADGESVRALLLGCDALVMPERTGTVRGLALEAMAAGTPIVARRDPMIEWLDGLDRRDAVDAPQADPTAIIVDDATTDAWESALRRVMSAEAERFVPAAREWVRLHHRASDHAATVLEICEQAIRGDAIPFETAG